MDVIAGGERSVRRTKSRYHVTARALNMPLSKVVLGHETLYQLIQHQISCGP